MILVFDPTTLASVHSTADNEDVITWNKVLAALPRGMHEEDRFTVHTFLVPDDPNTEETDAKTYIVSICRENCSPNTNEKDRVCADFGEIMTGTVNADNIQHGSADTGTDMTPLDLNSGNDTYYGGPGNDIVDGMAGDDFIDGGLGDDTLKGGAGEDVLISRDGYDLLDGGDDCDRFIIYPTHDHEHHYEEGCTQLVNTTEDETIEFRTKDDKCKLELDIWELSFYLDNWAANAIYKWDVWLTEDGTANICSSDTDMTMRTACGKTAGNTCWEFDVCPENDHNDIFDLIEIEEEPAIIDPYDSWTNWFGFSSSNVMGVEELMNEISFPGFDPTTCEAGLTFNTGTNQC